MVNKTECFVWLRINLHFELLVGMSLMAASLARLASPISNRGRKQNERDRREKSVKLQWLFDGNIRNKLLKIKCYYVLGGTVV